MRSGCRTRRGSCCSAAPAVSPARKKAAAAPATPDTAFTPCLADWQWWELSGPCQQRGLKDNLCSLHKDRGPGWTREWATSAFDPGVRFSYIALETISPPLYGRYEYPRPEHVPPGTPIMPAAADDDVAF